MPIEIADDNDQDLNEVKPSREAGPFGVLDQASGTKIHEDLKVAFLQKLNRDGLREAPWHRENICLYVHGKTWAQLEAEEEMRLAKERMHAASVRQPSWVDQASFIAPQQNAGLRAVAGASA